MTPQDAIIQYIEEKGWKQTDRWRVYSHQHSNYWISAYEALVIIEGKEFQDPREIITYEDPQLINKIDQTLN